MKSKLHWLPLVSALLALAATLFADPPDRTPASALVPRERLAWLDVRDYGGIPGDANDDTAAVTAALSAAATSATTRTVWLSPGEWKFNVTIPSNVTLIGCGTALDGNDPPDEISTSVIPASNAAPVIYVPKADSVRIADLHIEGNGAGTSISGIRVGDNSTFAGISAKFERLRINRFTTGFEARFVVGVVAEHVHVNYCGTGWKFDNKVDTSILESCGGNFNSGTIVDANEVRNLQITGGEWGNGPGPWLDLRGGYSNVVVSNCNVESITSDYLIEIDYPRLELNSVRIDVASANPDLVSYIRQSAGDARITVTNPLWFGGSPGYLWEGTGTMRPPTFIGTNNGTIRWATDGSFSSTARTGDPVRTGVLAYKTSNQTFTSGTAAVITWSTEVTDNGGNFDPATGLFTAPSAGWYQLNCSVFLNDANANYTRLFERRNGTNGAIFANANNHEAYRMIGGACCRYLSAGDTWGVALLHNKGSNLAIYATGGGQDGGISIVKLSD